VTILTGKTIVREPRPTRSQIPDFFSAPFWGNIPDRPTAFPPSPHDRASHTSPVLPDDDLHRTANPIDHPNGSVTNEKIADGTIDLTKKCTYIPLDKKVMTEFYLYIAHFPPNLPADSTGVKSRNGGVLLRSEVFNAVSAIYPEFSLMQLTGGTVQLELYDETAGVVRASTSLTSPVIRGRGGLNLKPYLTAGNTYSGRLNVTTAGATGSVAGDGWIRLVMVP
jgi:hypothetical protein